MTTLAGTAEIIEIKSGMAGEVQLFFSGPNPTVPAPLPIPFYFKMELI